MTAPKREAASDGGSEAAVKNIDHRASSRKHPTSGHCLCQFTDAPAPAGNDRSLPSAPTSTTAEHHFLRGLRDRWEDYYDQTGERRALEVIECLTFVLVEGGRLP